MIKPHAFTVFSCLDFDALTCYMLVAVGLTSNSKKVGSMMNYDKVYNHLIYETVISMFARCTTPLDEE